VLKHLLNLLNLREKSTWDAQNALNHEVLATEWEPEGPAQRAQQ